MIYTFTPLILSANPSVSFRCASIRPGVATMISVKPSPRLRAFTSLFMLVPPTSRVQPILWNVHSALASVIICCASSRVGERTSTLAGGILWPPEVRLACSTRTLSLSSTSTDGTKKARVFPVPVLAFTSTSFPKSTSGKLSCWTWVMYLIFMRSARARLLFSEIGRELNSWLVINAAGFEGALALTATSIASELPTLPLSRTI
mmetsp:Transcript_49338/g.97595  ORF Transcript_49338/g.97595 Transcript_49338/m.97595 type:complete len:204 (-) Transcript_49338:427-1038(-)